MFRGHIVRHSLEACDPCSYQVRRYSRASSQNRHLSFISRFSNVKCFLNLQSLEANLVNRRRLFFFAPSRLGSFLATVSKKLFASLSPGKFFQSDSYQDLGRVQQRLQEQIQLTENSLYPIATIRYIRNESLHSTKTLQIPLFGFVKIFLLCLRLCASTYKRTTYTFLCSIVWFCR